MGEGELGGRERGRGGRKREGGGKRRERRQREEGRESIMVTVDDIDSLFSSVNRNSTGPVTVKLVTAAEEFWQ